MPKVKKSYSEQKRLNAWSVVEKWRARNDYSYADICKLWGCAKSTITMRKKNPNSFRLFEIKAMDLSDDEILELVKGNRR